MIAKDRFALIYRLGSIVCLWFLLSALSFLWLYWNRQFNFQNQSVIASLGAAVIIHVLSFKYCCRFIEKFIHLKNKEESLKYAFWLHIPLGLFSLFFILQDGAPLFRFVQPTVIKSFGEINLKSPDGQALAMFQEPMVGIPNQKLKLTFEVSSAAVNSEIPLIIDIMGDKFDPAKLDVIFKGSQINPVPKLYSYVLEPGIAVPKAIYLRAYSRSTESVKITNFYIESLNVENPVLLFKILSEMTLLIWILLFAYFSSITSKQITSYLAGYVFLACIILIYVSLNFNIPFYHDSSGYWNWGKLFVKDGTFSLLNYDNSLRGYFLPLINFFIARIASLLQCDEILLFRGFVSLLYPYFIFILFPNFIENVFLINISNAKRIFFSFLFLLFWRGYILYPLTDFFSFFAIVGSMNILVSKKNHNKFSWCSYILSGFLIASAINMRPSYLIVLVLPLFYFLVKFNGYISRLVKNSIFYLLGIFIVFIPQSVINHRYFSTVSPIVQMGTFYGGQNILLMKLYGGLFIQKCETYVGSEAVGNQILADDPVGNELIRAADLKGLPDYQTYFKVVLTYPFSMLNIYLRHIFNGLNLMYDTPYIFKFESKLSYIYQIGNFTIWFLAIIILIVITSANRKKLCIRKNEIILTLITLIVPSVLIVPTEIETRYFLPLFMLAYILVSCLAGDLFFKNKVSYFIKKYSLVYLICIALFFIVSNNVFKTFYFK